MRKLIIVGTILAIALIAGTAFAIGEIGDQPCVNCPTSTSESEQIQTEESSELSFGASVAIVMLLGVAAATLVAGARTATRRG